jgi:hypothetical protein
MADPASNLPDPTEPPPVGLIDTAPGQTPTTSGTPSADATAYTTNAFTVTLQATVAGQIQNIIASGSPFMQATEARAKDQMNVRPDQFDAGHHGRRDRSH